MPPNSVTGVVHRESFLVKFGRFRELGLLAFIVAIMLFTQWKNDNFFTFENIDDLLANASILGILALGMMLVIIIRGIDLSIGATLALAGMIASLAVSRSLGYEPNGTTRKAWGKEVQTVQLVRATPETFKRPDWELQVMTAWLVGMLCRIAE